MTSLQTEVYTALTGTGYPVAYHFPQNAVIPRITFFENLNREWGQADGEEAVTEVEYTIDLWAMEPEETAEMAEAVDSALSILRLKRTFSYDLYEQDTRVHHKNMRYRALVYQDKIYQ